MNIIFISSQSAQARKIVLTKLHLIALAGAMVITVLLLALSLNFFSLRYADRIEAPVLKALLVSPQEKRHQKIQSQLHDNLNVMAVRLGKMQAQLLRLDAISAQLLEFSELEPDDFMLDRLPGQGGANTNLRTEALSFSGFERKLHELSRILEKRSDKLGALETLLRSERLSKRVMPSVMPIDTDWYSSGFGFRIDPFTGRRAFHEGVDFPAKTGTPIRAAAGGVIVYSDRHSQYGNMIEIDHGDDMISRYAHASKLHVVVGQVVTQGQEIAEVGSTGRSTGPHLHFEIRHKGVPQNPSRFLKKSG
ncbi:Peptidase family M23 [Nitrosomonas sp. Nm51]|uniref:M23 family metallopeptidase n=1 Tax=Nitrosomonas sp. Nm51 TaxID=133720 RepID=UPI0008AD863B|nr:M23 family metallopeptidase [Nitrosomonas sp. Nm51]SER68859.1 Peptidase family M23 [Nitrosomonas sp. Nm51]